MIEAFPGAWKSRKDKKLVYNLEEAAVVSFSSAVLEHVQDGTTGEIIPRSFLVLACEG